MDLKELKSIIREVITTISPSKIPNTMSLWHGGNLDDYNDNIAHKKGRFEYGPGLYLTTQHEVAIKYAKGSRRLYLVTIEKGIDISEVSLDYIKVLEFVNENVILNKRNEITTRLNKYNTDGKIPAHLFNNIVLNNDGIKPTNTKNLREFLLNNGIDYCIVDNAFGWGETMVVLYNMKKIIKYVPITSKDKLETYDLPTEFN